MARTAHKINTKRTRRIASGTVIVAMLVAGAITYNHSVLAESATLAIRNTNVSATTTTTTTTETTTEPMPAATSTPFNIYTRPTAPKGMPAAVLSGIALLLVASGAYMVAYRTLRKHT